MKTLFIKTEEAIENVLPDTPYLPDISSDLYFDFDARKLSLSEGATVTSWVADGPAPLGNKSLNTPQSSSTWVLPKFSLTSGPDNTPAITFDGINQRIRTTTSDITPYLGEFTIAIVGKAVPGDGVSSGRLYSSIFDALFVNTSGNIVIQQDNKTYLTTPNPNQYFVAVLSATDSGFSCMVSGMNAPVKTSQVNPRGYSGFGVGGSGAATLGTQVQGSVSRIMSFTRGFNREDIISMVNTLSEEYKIGQ